MQLVEFKKLPDGNLRISLLYRDAVRAAIEEIYHNKKEVDTQFLEIVKSHFEIRVEIEEISRNGEGIDAQFLEIIEYQLGEEWDLVRPEDVGALTSSLILSDSSVYADNGELDHIDDCWWFPNYQILSEVEELLKHGFIDYTLAEKWDES